MDSRAQFEDWLRNTPSGSLWDVWQASRATIEVTLPEKVMVEDDYDRGHNYGVEYCEEAIIAAGISIKGEPS